MKAVIFLKTYSRKKKVLLPLTLKKSSYHNKESWKTIMLINSVWKKNTDKEYQFIKIMEVLIVIVKMKKSIRKLINTSFQK
jgi:hypothetical protein